MSSTTKHSSSSSSRIPTWRNLPVPYKCLSLTRNRQKWRNTFFTHLLVCQNSCSACQHLLPSRLADFTGVSKTQKPPTAWEDGRGGIKYEWKWGSQRQNKFLYFAIMLRPMQEIHGTSTLLEALSEGWGKSPEGAAALSWSSPQGKWGKRLGEIPNAD